MNERINELRLDAGIARIENQKWLCVLDKESGMMIDPMIGIEKFAELLIEKVCYDIMNVHGASPEHIALVAKHYGVEL